jgi:hypothetical protein
VKLHPRTGPDEIALWPRVISRALSSALAVERLPGAQVTRGRYLYWSKGDLATFEKVRRAALRRLPPRNPSKFPWARCEAPRRDVPGLGPGARLFVEVFSNRLAPGRTTVRTNGRPTLAPVVEAGRTTLSHQPEMVRAVTLVSAGSVPDIMSGNRSRRGDTTRRHRTLKGCGRFL